MKQESYSVEWFTFSDHLKQMLLVLEDDNPSKDVTLVCDGKIKLKAHKFVLTSSSSVFKEILKEDSPSTVYLKGIESEEMQAILQFVYQGQTMIRKERMSQFLDVAKNLEVKELYQEAQQQGKDDPIPLLEDNHLLKDNSDEIMLKMIIDYAAMQCPKCNKMFTKFEDTKEHYEMVHLGNNIDHRMAYDCKICRFQATSKSILSSHYKMHLAEKK